jgi:5-methylcytosine-specific restriction endonuclease McrA
MLYKKYDPATYITRELYRKVCETGDLRYVWAHKNANKWSVEYDSFLKLCGEKCAICDEKLDYGLGKNNNDKNLENTPSTHHIIPQSKGGQDKIENFSIICMRCNEILTNSTHKEIHRYIKIAKFLEKYTELYEEQIYKR